MSRRTSDSNKAIREKWAQEKELVSKGQGTRDWTPEQQREILELGRAYYHSDDSNDTNDGKALEGHHMKSAEKYPEYQGDSGNIQFLTRAEHQKAHGGNFRNPTNGYYDPVEKVTHDFGDGKYKPCEIIKLSEPICAPTIETKSNVSEGQDVKAEENSSSAKSNNIKKSASDKIISGENIIKTVPDTQKETLRKTSGKGKGIVESVMGTAKSAIKKVTSGIEKHPTEVRFILGVIGAAIVVKQVNNGGKNLRTDDVLSLSDNSNEFAREDGLDCPSNYVDESENHDSDIETENEPKQTNYPEKRKSPVEHDVGPSGQHYHTKDGIVFKDKGPYHRGGKKNDGDNASENTEEVNE